MVMVFWGGERRSEELGAGKVFLGFRVWGFGSGLKALVVVGVVDVDGAQLARERRHTQTVGRTEGA